MTKHAEPDEGLRRIHRDPSLVRVSADAANEQASPRSPKPVPWPARTRPVPMKLHRAARDPLPVADVLVVTWTSGEARTMGTLFADQPLDDWRPYQNGLAAYLPLVTGKEAPFNDDDRENARYYHTLGLYCAVTIGQLTVVVVKSGLHPAYDGPALPMKKLWQQIIAEVRPKLVITTGTAGGIGASTKLGDVVIANAVRFHCTGQFKDQPFAHASYACSPLDVVTIEKLAARDLFAPNTALLPGGHVPTLILPTAALAKVVTTDTFAFDDATNTFGLQGLGSACDMGDAVLGLAMADVRDPPAWVSIRNASDPQISDPGGELTGAKKTAEDIYNEYQEITTAGSVVATWATIMGQLG